MKRSLGLRDVHVYLTPEQYEFLARQSFERHMTMSHIAREVIEEARRRDLRRKREQATGD